MTEAICLLVGIVIGWAACLYAPRRKGAAAKVDKYEDYRNEQGRFTRRAIESKAAKKG